MRLCGEKVPWLFMALRFFGSRFIAPSPYGTKPCREDAMTVITDRLDLRLNAEERNRLRRATDLHDLPLATFVCGPHR